MQVISDLSAKRKVHFEAPPSDRMTQEMTAFVGWFNETAPGGKRPLPALTRAGVAHLYFVSIHPFEDGNGRIGRALAEKSLAQNLGQPTLIALAYTIQRKRKAYYDALERNNKSTDIADWLKYFAETVLEAQDNTLKRVDFYVGKAKFYERLRGQFNDRQEKAIARMLHEGIDGFKGGLSAEKYIAITQATRATATRDLQDLDDRFHETSLHGTMSLLADSSFGLLETRIAAMGRWRQAVELALSDEDITKLVAISRSRTERGSRVVRARTLLAYRENPSFFAIGRAVGVHHQTVERCVERALAYGPLAALDDRPRPGKEPTITPEAKAWLVSLACDKAKDHGYPHELWTTRLLADHARKQGPAAGHRCLAHLVQGTVCKILGNEEIKPHKVRYYLENRDAEFERKMAEVLCVYREVEVLKKARAKSNKGKPVAIVSCDEKPGIQAIATTAPDLPPEPGIHPTFARDHEYKRHGTLSLLAGIDLLTGKVHALVKDRHRSREFIEFLKLLDAAYPAGTVVKLILDNHSAHISKETRAWLATRPTGRFELTFTPTHGSWLNLIEGFFSKLTRSVLRHIRVTSKLELKQRIMAGIRDINRRPVIHTWSYKLAEAA
jgi:transposase